MRGIFLPSYSTLRSWAKKRFVREVFLLCQSPVLVNPTLGEPVGCREWGWSQRVLFSNDRNVVGYVIGILILLQTTQGCKGLVPTSHLERNHLEPGRGRALLAVTPGGGGLGPRLVGGSVWRMQLPPSRFSLSRATALTCGTAGASAATLHVYKTQVWESVALTCLPR